MSIQVTVDPDGPVLRFARRYPHPIEKVWAALTEPAQMSRWFPCEVQAEMRVGGTITLTFEGGEQDHAEITELEPPTAFGFTWADERLRWTLDPDGDGCVLRLSNTVLDPRWAANTAAGWDRCFEALAAHLGRSDLDTTPGPDEALIAHYRSVLGSGARHLGESEPRRYGAPVIVWLNGGFGAGKTTLAAELHRRLPDAVVYDPEDVGLMLWKWLPPNEDFQDLPSWRELVVATALSLRRHHARTLIVPMSLLRDGYRAEILDGLAAAGEEVLHVFLDTAPEVLRDRLRARTPPPDDHRPDGSALDWALSRLDPAAAGRQPAGTLVLRSDRLTPTELADTVLAAADRPS